MKVAERFSQLLADRGIHEIFGNPGTTELPLLEGIRQRYFLTLHDAIALGAADGHAQVRRSVAVANLHAAPGLGNSIAFLDSARRNHSPVLVTVGQQDLRHVAQRPLLFGDFESMVAGLVKYSHEVHSGADLESAVRTAFRQALEPPMGPVLLSLPMDVMEAEALVPVAGGGNLDDPETADEPIERIAERLRGAARPALVVGHEVDSDGAFPEVERLAKHLGAPVYAEPICSRAPIPAELANFAGDLLPQSAMISSVLGDYDLVVLVGADLTLYPYSPAPLPGPDRLAYLGSDPSVPQKLGCERALGRLPSLIRALLAELPESGRRYARPRDLARANRVARAAARMGAEFVVDAISRHFHDHTVVDESVSWIPTMKGAGFYRGADSYFSSRSQQLGWGLAAAIGIGLERPRTAVVLGDGSLQYSVQALWTLGRYRIPVKVVVVNNGGYAILKSYSKANHPGLARAEYLDLPGVDVVGLARSYGLPADSVATPGELDAALDRLKGQDGPALLNIEVDRTVPDLFS